MNIKVNNIFKNIKKKNKNKNENNIKSNVIEEKNNINNNINNKKKDNYEQDTNIIKNIDFRKKKVKSDDKLKSDNTKNSDNIIVYKRKGARFIDVETETNKKAVNENDVKTQRKVKRRSKQGIHKSYLTLFFCMLILGIFSLDFAIKSYNKYEREDYVVYGKTKESSVSSGNIQDNMTNNKDANEVNGEVISVNSSLDDNTTVKEQTNTNTNTKKVEPLNFSKPIDGEIQKIFSSDKVIYSKTLEMWKTHDGIDISATIGQIVKSIEKGVIERIYNDSFLGTTVIIDHSQGYKSCYSNLDENVLVKEKQVITKGTKIGKVGKTSIGEFKDDTHLHFSLVKNNEIVDPTYIFK